MRINRCFLAVVLLLEGCAISPKATLLREDTGPHNIVATDSRLRVVSSSQQAIFSTTGLVEPKRIICTEPSPDVATTIANSFGVGLSVFGQGSASLSAQQVEGLVQLGERTAAIQLLRDKMYQMCIAYANGAVSGTTYSLIMSRLDESIVTLSLGDNAAGAFGRKLAGIGGEASAKAEATLIGLPREIARIEEQAGKLAEANKKVDDAAKSLEAHKGTKPDTGKENDYKAQTAKLEGDLATAKAERNALLELVRSTAKSATEASGKISQLQTGGDLHASPNATALRDMQADFLLSDSGRDLVFACTVELGLRGDGGGDEDLKKITQILEDLYRANPTNGGFASSYAGAILRGRSTALAKFCAKQLPKLIVDVSQKSHEYRMQRARLSPATATARYGAENAKASARERELFMDSIRLCNTDFKEDAERRKACLDRVIPIQTADQVKPKPSPKAKP